MPKPSSPTRRRRWLRRTLAGVALVATALALYVLSNTYFESSPEGVHERLLVALGKGRGIAIPAYGGSGDAVRLPGFLDGPVVRRDADGAWSARWFCEDRAFAAEGRGDTLVVDCAGRRHAFGLAPGPEPAGTLPMPSRVAVLSDLEGNHAFAMAALARLGVVDDAGHWAWGQGHLVVLGDSVDRGRDVFALLWALHALSAEAREAGGAVHVLVGNHEQYVLRGNISRAHPAHRYALQQLGGYEAAFARGTVLGDWLAAQPVALVLGDTLFVHGGISPAVVAAGFDVAGLNRAHRDYWRPDGDAELPTPALDAVLGPLGVTQYRGLLMAVEDRYPMAGAEDVVRALAHFGVRRLVVAHTQVPRVQALHDGRVWAVNVNDEEARPEVLVFEQGQPRVVDIGIGRGLARPGTTLRPFEFTRASDWRALGAVASAVFALSRLPHPY